MVVVPAKESAKKDMEEAADLCYPSTENHRIEASSHSLPRMGKRRKWGRCGRRSRQTLLAGRGGGWRRPSGPNSFQALKMSAFPSILKASFRIPNRNQTKLNWTAGSTQPPAANLPAHVPAIYGEGRGSQTCRIANRFRFENANTWIHGGSKCWSWSADFMMHGFNGKRSILYKT